ncbi:MAG TPA: VanW family protein [Syntrophomonadaceae bacterium]|nr:VanW family protein [Syntrophomonadaceae bacterium]
MSRKYLKLWVAVAITAGILCAVGVYLYQWSYHSDRFLPGVEIATVKVEGLTRDAAVVLLKDHLAELEKTEVRFYTDAYSTDALLSEISSRPDVEQYIDRVWQEEQTRSFGSKIIHAAGTSPVTYYPEIEYRRSALETMAAEWDRDLGSECKDARLEIDARQGLVVIPEQQGRGVNVDGVLNKLPHQWAKFSDTISVPIVIDEKQPTVKAADLHDMGQLSSFTTSFKTYETNRSSNLRRAAASINGRMIPLNTVFSFNDTVGERTVNSGYSDAMVIVGDKFEPGLGGGVCQVSSTLYNAVLMAGLEIVERHNHNLAVVYVPQGLDATVSYGSQDFRFKNSSSAPLYIQAFTDGGQLTISLYGNLKDKVNVKLSHMIDQVIPFGETQETDPSLAAGQQQVDHGGQVGYSTRAYRAYYDASDNLIKRELLSSDYYSPLNRVVRVGPSQPVSSQPTQTGKTDPNTVKPDPGSDIKKPPTVNDSNTSATSSTTHKP